MPESTGFAAAPGGTATLPGSPSGAGKGGGGALPRSEYPFVPQWMQQRSGATQRAPVTPAMNPGQGAGRFMGQSPAAPPPVSGPQSGGLMGRSATPTATPVVRPTQASTVLRPSVTPSIYEEWKGYNAEKKNIMEGQGGDLSAIIPSGIYKGFTVGDAMQFSNYWQQHPETQGGGFGGGGGGTGGSW